MIRVLHLSYSDLRGGAAIGANRLHRALRAGGMESDMLVIDKMSHDPYVHKLMTPETVEFQREINKQSRELKSLYGDKELPIRSFNLFGIDVAERINEFPCDVVHFHWVAQNTIRLTDIPNIRKPIIWKMPDMWPFSGGEHYISAHDTPYYKQGYPGADEKGIDFDEIIWRIKKAAYQQASLTITSPSRFLARCAHESQALGDFDAHVIPNPLPDDLLYAAPASPQKIIETRTKYRFPLGKALCVFSAYSTAEKRKGFHHVLEMLKEHLPSRLSAEDIAFVVLGGNRFERQSLYGYDIFFTPRIDNSSDYADIMQCADMLLCPSEMDSTAMVVQEANALGVPSVVFDVGGMPEIVRHKKNGFVAEPYSAEGLAEGLRWLADDADPSQLAANGRRLARDMHDGFQCASRYVSVYEDACRRYRKGQDFKTGQFYDFAVADEGGSSEPPRVILIDPSVVKGGDSSHNTATARMFSAVFHAAKLNTEWIINDRAETENPFGKTHKILPYTAYDKIRTGLDATGRSHDVREMTSFEDTPWPEEREIYDVLSSWFDDAGLVAKDMIFVPMTDRILFDAILALYVAKGGANFPRVTFNFMFEKGNFLRGGYPLERMTRRLKATGVLGTRFFVCVETEAMAETLTPLLGICPLVVRPPVSFARDTIHEAMTETRAADEVVSAYRKAGYNADAYEKDLPTELAAKKSDEIWVASLGRGRRDKGFARLPGILRGINEQKSDITFKFLIQRPRAMDELETELAELESMQNAILLDEFLDETLLDKLQGDADIILLPYDKWVYGNRGSAFVWRAIAEGKPLVVSRQTGLCEGLLTRNGIAALKNEDFAEALVEIASSLGMYKDRAHAAAIRLFEICHNENPLLTLAAEKNFDHHERRLFVGRRLDELPAEHLSGPWCGLELCTENSEDYADDRHFLGHFTWCPGLESSTLRDLPKIIYEGFEACTFSEVVLSDECYGLPVIRDYFVKLMGDRPVRCLGDLLGQENGQEGLAARLVLELMPNLAGSLSGLSADMTDKLSILIGSRLLFGIEKSISEVVMFQELADKIIQNKPLAHDILGNDQDLNEVLEMLRECGSRKSVTLVAGSGCTPIDDRLYGEAIEVGSKFSLFLSAADVQEGTSLIQICTRLRGNDRDVKVKYRLPHSQAISPLVTTDKIGQSYWLLAVEKNASFTEETIVLSFEVLGNNHKKPINSIIALEAWVMAGVAEEGSDPLSAMRTVPLVIGDVPGEYHVSSESPIHGTLKIEGQLPSPHSLGDAAVYVDGRSQLAAVEKDEHSITLRLPMTLALHGGAKIRLEMPNGEIPAVSSLTLQGGASILPSVSVPSDPQLEGQLRLLSFGFPRARFAQWRFCLLDALFDGQSVGEIRFQLSVHDLVPFLALAEGAWNTLEGSTPKFGDDLRLVAHRRSSYEQKLRSLPIMERRILVALALKLPEILSHSRVNVPSRELADRVAKELFMGTVLGLDEILREEQAVPVTAAV